LNGFHLVNVLLHATAAVLTWRVLLALRIPGAWAAGAIFAVHPVCVGSVAWISEIKNTLSQVLFLLSLLFYLRFDAGGRRRMYAAAVAMFCLALLAKPSVVPLPAILLLCAWWRRGMIVARDGVRTLPFVAVALLAGIAAVYLQFAEPTSAEGILIGGPISRLANAGLAVWFYLTKAILPVNLLPLYPAWDVSAPPWFRLLPAIALVVIFAACAHRRRRWWARSTLFALAYYTLMLLPALGFVKMSYMRVALVADHFQYASIAGAIALFAAAAARCAPRRLFELSAAAVLIGFSVLSWRQAGIYRNEETLWTATLARNPDSWQAHNLLGVALWKKGEPADAAAVFEHFRRAAELNPGNPEVHNNLALAYGMRGDVQRAIDEYRAALAIEEDAAIRTNLGIALSSLRRLAEAEEQYRHALRLEPGDASRHVNVGYVLMQQGRLEEARVYFEQALAIDPTQPQARQSLRYLEGRRQSRPPN
jgi:Flp pilus assembly protein TadD